MIKKVVGLCITLLFLWFALYNINISGVVSIFKLFHLSYLPVIVIFYILSLCIRGIRWKLLLCNNNYSWLHLAELSTAGTMLNIFIPARAGDLFRAYYLGKIKEESKLKIFGSIILERLFDGLSVFIILFLSIKIYFSHSEVLNITAKTAGIIFVGSIITAYLLLRTRKIKCLLDFIKKKIFPSVSNRTHIFVKLNKHINSFCEGFQAFENKKILLQAFICSIAIWGLECFVVHFIINSFELVFPLSAAFFVLSLTTFSTMLPSTSIFLGPFQGAYILALGIYGADKEMALAISVIHNMILIVIISAIGLLWMLQSNFFANKNTLNE